MNTALLHIENLSVSYGPTPVLEGVNLNLYKGDLAGITGENGSGKSTLLKTVCRKIRENSGTLSFAGINLLPLAPHQLVRGWPENNAQPGLKKGISTLYQSSLVFPSLTVEEHLLMALNINPRPMPLDAIYTEFESRGLSAWRSRRAGNLSGGQRQLLSLALLLAHQNCLWLLDEPFAGLDQDTADFTEDWLRKKNAAGVTMLVIAHEPERIRQLCRSVWHLRDSSLQPVPSLIPQHS